MTFRSKTILGIAAIETVFLVVIVISAMSFLTDSNEKLLIQRANSTATMLAHSSKDAILSTDIATLDDLVNELITLEDVAYVRILRGEEELACAGDKSLLDRNMHTDINLDTVSDGVFDVRVPVKNDNQVYGYVDIGFAISGIHTMLTTAKQSIIGIAIVEVTLVAIFSFALGSYLTKSLVKLTKAAQTLSRKGPGFQLNEGSNDELGDVARAFDDMSAQLEKTYKDLDLARVEAEQACASKSRFLASMSHEIRTPMNGVLGILNLLEETKLNPQQKKLISTATESGHFLLTVINDILDFIRMESNTLCLKREPFDFKQCVESVVDSYLPVANQRDLILHCFIEGPLSPEILGDENRLKQILHNLIGNAIKFTKQGSVTIKVSTEINSKQQLAITCKVIDTGVGIKKSAMDYLFEEFTMADQSYSRNHDGSGLGLAICKKLTELMDGTIEVDSIPDEGSTFVFSAAFDIAKTGPQDNAHSPQETLIHKQCKILVAEDNKANQLVIKNMFHQLGIQIDLADNGKHAVAMAASTRYDLIFMDVSMPEMDGLEATQKIKNSNNPEIAAVPIVALTAHALTGDKEKFLSAGMNDYLSKPVRRSQLIEKINLFLSKAPLVSYNKEKPQLVENKELVSESASWGSDMIEERLVDETIIQQVIDDTCAEVLPELIDHYIQESKLRLEKIIQAMDEQNGASLEFETHTLGSSALALGNRPLSNLSRKIEHLCVEGMSKEAYQLKDDLLELAQASLAAIELRKQQGFS